MLKSFTYRLESCDWYTRERTVVSHVSLLCSARSARVKDALVELPLGLLLDLLFGDGVRQLVAQLPLQLAPPGSLDTLQNKGISVLKPYYNFIE
jgi:hypothetical protein